jgi:hypothetical protein
MVQVTFDTKNDSLEELENALHVLHDAIHRRKGTVEAPAKPAAPVEEPALDTPFLKISITSEGDQPAAPTLNELLTNESLTEDELTTMFKTVQESEPQKKPVEKKPTAEATFIEIVDFEEEEK